MDYARRPCEKLVRSKKRRPRFLADPSTSCLMIRRPTRRAPRDAEIVNRAAIARLYNRDPRPERIIVVNHDHRPGDQG